MKKIVTILLITIGFYCQGQSVVATAGETYTSNGVIVSWTIGELVTGAAQVNGVSICQGFHQSDFVITGIQEYDFVKSINIYPNPTLDVVTIDFDRTRQITLTLVDTNGNIMLERKADDSDSEKLNLTQITNGIYYLKAQTANFSNPVIYKIIKTSR